MKKLALFLFLLIASVIFQKGIAQVPHYEITGRVEGAEGVTFTLQKMSAGKVIYLDTTVVQNGMFKITGGSVEYPERVSLVTLDRKKGMSFYLENSEITITGKLDSLTNASVRGSKSNDEYSEFLRSIKPYTEKQAKLRKDYNTANEAIIGEIKNVQKNFVKNNPGSFVSPILLRALINDLKPEEIESIIRSMDPEVAKSPDMIKIMTEVSVAPGKKAPDFTLNDVNGKPVSLSSKVGARLLMIDFWAGWCGPCRQENPNVLKVYNEFNKKGFDIIGVSLDRTRDEWVKAIADDKLPWTQVSDLKYFNSSAAKLYNVTAIPANFLLDEKGIIIATNLRGEALSAKIKGILGAR
ncbi:MAG: AhpC/TSA family protein [Bacteroidales bacterium]|nr:AhpC/TSA family protein [Bacteroidales bacterium]